MPWAHKDIRSRSMEDRVCVYRTTFTAGDTVAEFPFCISTSGVSARYTLRGSFIRCYIIPFNRNLRCGKIKSKCNTLVFGLVYFVSFYFHSPLPLTVSYIQFSRSLAHSARCLFAVICNTFNFLRVNTIVCVCSCSTVSYSPSSKYLFDKFYMSIQ